MEGDYTDRRPNGILTVCPQLLDISDQKFRQIVQLLDAIQHKNEVREVLDYVRPRITKLRPPRPLTLRRLCYLPAEDLLVYDRRTATEGLITRLAMGRAWSFISSQFDDGTYSDFSGKLKQIDPRDTAEINNVGAAFWPVATEILKLAIETSLHDKSLRQSLLGGDVEIMVDLVQIARILGAGNAIQTLKMGLPPRPMGELTAAQLEAARYLIRDSARSDVESAYSIILAIAVRLEVPGNLLYRLPRLLHEFSEEDRDAITDRLTTFVVGDMAARTSSRIYGKEVDVAERALRAGSLVQSLVAAERSLRTVAPIMKRDLKSIRATAESVIGEIVSEARQVVDAAVSAGPAAPLDQRMASEQNLIALRRCARFAEKVGLDNKVTDALQNVSHDMRGRVERIIEAIVQRGHDVAEDDLPFQNWSQNERNEFVWAVRMLEVSGEIEEAATIWRRINTPHPRPPTV